MSAAVDWSIQRDCPSCHASGIGHYGRTCHICEGSTKVTPWKLREPCRKCHDESRDGIIRKAGPQTSAYCALCLEHAYMVPKHETGEAPRSLRSRPDLGGMRDHILKLDGYRCFLCGRGSEQGVFLQIAHALSRSEGLALGVPARELDSAGNLFACCEECNSDMGSLSVDPKFYLRLMMARIRRAK